ncbi:MAG TPA: hypothetical protein VMZ28_21860 [Kofleriaceae bacterium]|nr:hypothetical protein [Kofleriaceae bacterium]
MNQPLPTGDPKVVLAITPDKALGKTLRTALTSAGAAVTVLESVQELPRGPIRADLVVVHQPAPDPAVVRDIALRVPEHAFVIPLLPRGNLPAAVESMKCHERVAGVLGADAIRGEEVTAMATRLLFGDIFGLAKVLPWGARIHSLRVGSKDEKTAAIDEVSKFAAAIGVRRKYRDAIKQCCDEMLMNAIYDAPVGPDGVPLSKTMSRKNRPTLTGENRAVIEYGCDGRRFAVAVKDHYGRFERKTLVEYLDKCLHAKQQIDDKPGGAGLGLYFMSNSATTLMFNVQPGIATECVCTFDIDASKLALEQLGVFREARGSEPAPLASFEPAAARAQTATPAPSTGRGVVVMLVGVILVLLAIAAVIGVPRLMKYMRERDAPSSQPSQTQVDIDPQPVPEPTAVPLPVPPPPPGALTVRSNVAARISVEPLAGGAAVCPEAALPLDACPLAAGSYRVLLRGDDPFIDQSFEIEVADQPVERQVDFGLIEAKEGYVLAREQKSDDAFKRMALPGGRQTVWVVSERSKRRKKVDVPIHLGQTVIVP